MYILSFSVLLSTIFCCVLSTNEDVVDKRHEEDKNTREDKQLRDSYDQEGWRAVDPTTWQGSEEWVPRSPLLLISENPPRQFQRRRRIRKRKRRPVIVLNSEEAEEYRPRRRRIRPQTLEDINDSWVEIEEESVNRPYSRRRTTPVYIAEVSTESEVSQTEEVPVSKPSPVYEKVRNPFTALEEDEAKVRSRKKPQEIVEDKEESTTIPNLKALLKQTSGSLSLSEILQKKNLSLDDLLKGKQHAISALTEKPETVTDSATTTEYKHSTENFTTETWLPRAKLEIIKTTDRAFESDEEISVSTVGSYIQRKTSNTIKNYEEITESTTERRIFVPSHPKHYTFFNYRPNILNKTIESTTSRFIQTTHSTPNVTPKLITKYFDYRLKYASLKPKLKTSLPITSAKLNRFTSKKPTREESTTEIIPIPSQAFKIDLKEIFGISSAIGKNKTKEPKEDKYEEEGPIKMVIDLQELMKKAESGTTTTENILIYLVNNSENEVKENESTTTQKVIYDKVKPTSAREEIMEILRDHVSRQNLSRILELRNMTIEELVAQRERGSSQLHLADIFHNQTREPEPPSEPFIGHIAYDRKPKAVHPKPTIGNNDENSQHSSYFTSSVIDVKPTKSQYTSREDNDNSDEPLQEVVITPKYTVTSFPTYKIEMEKIIKHNQPPPFQISIWKNLYPNLYLGESEDSNPAGELDKLKTTKVVDVFDNDIRRVEDIENTISDAINSELNIDLKENNFDTKEDYIQLPRGVKSAIIASAAIIAISVFIFLTVFFIFKWSQKQKKRMCYSSSFSCSRIKSPILEVEPRRTFRTFVSETLGRKKRYSNVYPQSMSDHIWDNDKKPFQ